MRAFILNTLVSVSSNPPPQAATKKLARKAVKQILRVDSSKLNCRYLNHAQLKRLLRDPAYNYDRENSLTFWERFWRWFWHLFEGQQHESSSTTSIPYLKYIFAGAIIIGVIYVFVKLMGVDLGNVFSAKPSEIKLGYGPLEENIHEINFDDDIKKAIDSGNYRLAVRLHYLRILKELNDAQLINWTLEKTNLAYINELTDDAQRRQFALITRQFEYVWYGEFPVDGRVFKSINSLFDDFKISRS